VTFEEFVALRLGALVRYATVVTWDPYLAEDITQEVLVRAQARWSRIGGLDAPEQYVKRMVLNEFLSWRRRKAAHVVLLPKEALDGIAPHAAETAGGDRVAVLRGPVRRADRRLPRLSDRDRPKLSLTRAGHAACRAARPPGQDLEECRWTTTSTT
jgi:DNA-directed RNA polymerase specialized sigma24 family protein